MKSRSGSFVLLVGVVLIFSTSALWADDGKTPSPPVEQRTAEAPAPAPPSPSQERPVSPASSQEEHASNPQRAADESARAKPENNVPGAHPPVLIAPRPEISRADRHDQAAQQDQPQQTDPTPAPDQTPAPAPDNSSASTQAPRPTGAVHHSMGSLLNSANSLMADPSDSTHHTTGQLLDNDPLRD